MTSFLEVVSAVHSAMAEVGLSPSGNLVADGTLRRVHLEGDRAGSRNGWYVSYLDHPASAAFGCWRRGVQGTWTALERARLTNVDLRELRRRAAEQSAARQAEQEARHRTGAQRASAIWGRAKDADPAHPYLVRKRVTPGLARQRGDTLVLPVLDLERRIWSLQFIDPSGAKKLLSGGRKKGNCIAAGGRLPGADRILICEGWGTGRSLFEMDPDALVLAAIDAGNLRPLAEAVRRRWPSMPIVVCADADDVGIRRGREAAIAVGGQLAVPAFPPGAEGSDFNDLATLAARSAA